MMSEKKILLGFGEALAAPEVCFSLRKAGWDIVSFTRNKRTCSLRFLPFVKLVEIPSPEDGTGATLDAIARLVASTHADALMPADDVSLWLCNGLVRDNRLGADCRAICAGPEAVAVALDKSQQVRLAAEAGLDVPPTCVAKTGADTETWSDFPCIAKPAPAVCEILDHKTPNKRLGKGDFGTFNDNKTLAAWIDARAGDGPFLVQPQLQGIGEGVFGLYRNGQVIAWSGHRRLRMMNPHGSGSSACISHEVSEDLKPKITDFLHRANWSGYFMIEFLRDADNRLWFMELNGRAWGSLALARRGGFDYPAWMVESTFDPTHAAAPPPVREGVVARHLGRELLHFAFVLKGPNAPSYKDRWPGRVSTLVKVLQPCTLDTFYNYSPEFPAFFLRDSLQTLRNFVSKRPS